MSENFETKSLATQGEFLFIGIGTVYIHIVYGILILNVVLESSCSCFCDHLPALHDAPSLETPPSSTTPCRRQARKTSSPRSRTRPRTSHCNCCRRWRAASPRPSPTFSTCMSQVMHAWEMTWRFIFAANYLVLLEIKCRLIAREIFNKN